MSTLDTTRHMEIFEPHGFTDNINIIGAGATGSWLALYFAKLGVSGDQIHVWDFDAVESHNVPNQLYGMHNVGENKALALRELIQQQTGTKINVSNEKFEQGRLSGYVYLMVDSMAERKRIWEESIKMKSAVKLLIEPRMGLHVGRVYNVEPMNLTHVRAYEACYYPDDVAEESACGASMTVITSAVGVATWCARQLINRHAEVEIDNEILIDFMFNNIIATQW